MVEIDNGAWDQEIAQLHLEQLRFLVKEEKRAIDRLDNDYGLPICSEVANHEVVRVALEVERVDFLILREGVVMNDEGDGEFPRMQHANRHRLVWVSSLEVLLRYLATHKFGRTVHLQDGRLQVLLDNHILSAESSRLRTEYPDYAFEAAHDDLVHWWVGVVHVSNAD